MLDFLLWYVVISGIGWLAFPIAYRLLPQLADRGFALARPLGLLLWAFAFWLLATLGVLQNDVGGVVLGLALMAALAGWCLQAGKLAEIRAWVGAHWKQVFVSEVIFLLAFFFMAVMRAADGIPLHTEQPMELAFLNSILRSPSFPPADPWLSGYGISYYYFGYVMVGMLARITGVVSGVAFNLGVALWFAMTALGAYGMLYSLLTAWFRNRRREQGKAEAAGKAPARWLSLFGPFYILIVSNLQGLLEILHNNGTFWERGVDGVLRSDFWRWLNIQGLSEPPPAPFSLSPGSGWWWWHSARVLSDWRLSGAREEIIDEYPFFTYYLSDLHPHLLSMPFVLLAIGLAVNLFFSGKVNALISGGVKQVWKRADFWAAAFCLGALGPINIWDFPIYAALFSAVYVFLRYNRFGWGWSRITDFFKLLIALGIGGVVLFLPFYLGFSSQASGVVIPSMVFFTHGKHFWIMFGSLLAPILAWLIWLWRQRGNQQIQNAGVKFVLVAVFGLWLLMMLAGMLVLILPGLGSLLVNPEVPDSLFSRIGAFCIEVGNRFYGLQGSESGWEIISRTILDRLRFPATWITLGAVLFLTWGLLSSHRGMKAAVEEPPLVVAVDGDENEGIHPNALVLLLILLGAGLTLVPEFFYLQDLFFTRMNTIFKLYFQAWMVWGLAAAYGGVVLWQRLRGKSAIVYGIGWTVVLAIALIIPFFGIGERLCILNPGTCRPVKNWHPDINSHLQGSNPDEWEAILWLRQAPYGYVSEAVGGSYDPGYARVATNSGLPTVLGWPWHEVQWRGMLPQPEREEEIRKLYETISWIDAENLLKKYTIRYVYIGGAERYQYRVYENKFYERLPVVFANHSVVIFEYLNPEFVKGQVR